MVRQSHGGAATDVEARKTKGSHLLTETPDVAPHDIHIMGLRGLIGQQHARVFAKRTQPLAERNVDIHRQLLLAVERQNLLANEGLLAVEGLLANEGLLAVERQLVPAPSVACPMVRTQRIGGVPLWLMLALLKQRCYVVVCLHSFLKLLRNIRSQKILHMSVIFTRKAS